MINEDTAALGIKDDAKSSDAIILRQAIIAELDAASLYEQMAASTTNKKLQKVLLDIAKEEKVHVGEFEKLLGEVDKEHNPAVEDGQAEVADLTSEDIKRIAQSLD